MWTLSPKANPSGCCLMRYVDDAWLAVLKQLFGEPGYSMEDEKGYKNEYVFTNADGMVVMLYDRWGAWRIGAWNTEVAEDFYKWLREKLASVGGVEHVS